MLLKSECLKMLKAERFTGHTALPHCPTNSIKA